MKKLSSAKGKRAEPKKAATHKQETAAGRSQGKSTASEPKKTRKKPDPKRRIRRRIIWLSVLGVVLLGLLLLRIYISMPDRGVDVLPTDPGDNVNEPDVTIEPGVSASPGATTSPPATAAPTPEGMAVRDDIYTFLLVGSRDGLTDTIMVATFDAAASRIEVLSIPRDTVVPSATRSVKKINGAYNSAGGGERGINRLKAEVSTLVGFVPLHTVLVDMKAFVEIIDLIGGVEFTVPMDMYIPEALIDLKKGKQRLYGEEALQLVRYRNYGGGGGIASNDYGRMQVQQMFLQAAFEQAMTPASIPKIPGFIEIGYQYLDTGMTLGEMLAIAEKVFMDDVSVSFNTLPSFGIKDPVQLSARGSYVGVKPEEALALINSTINPYTRDITAEMLDYIDLTN